MPGLVAHIRWDRRAAAGVVLGDLWMRFHCPIPERHERARVSITSAAAPRICWGSGRSIAIWCHSVTSICNCVQICWDGGELVCCSECPAAYHAACLGVSLQVCFAVSFVQHPLY